MLLMRDALDFRRKTVMPKTSVEFYTKVRGALPHYHLVEQFDILPTTGRAFRVARGQVARFFISHGPQIVDLDVFNAEDPREHLWANQTLNSEGFWLSTFSRMWSNLPWLRPLATIVQDTVKTDQTTGPARHHHIFGGHCNAREWYAATGKRDLPNCYENLCKSVAPFGLPPESIHDNLNLFQKTVLLANGTLNTVRSDARVGDFVDFYAEIDLLMAASLCPRGSGATELSDPNQETYPILVQVFETGVIPTCFVS
jgi:uncharacterized protein YcgI (DUF1989 family)